jgi:hypothetical protein
MERIELIIAVVTILGSGAAFKFYENLIKTKKAEARELRQERREENPETMFREDLLKRVEEMSAALESANVKILGLTQKVAELETENRYLQREIDILKRKYFAKESLAVSNKVKREPDWIPFITL